MLRKIPLIFFPVLTSVLLILAYPKFNQGWLAWFALAPLAYYLLRVENLRGAALGGLLCGALAYAGILYWIYPTLRAGGVGPAVSALGLLLLALTLALEFAGMAVYGFFQRRAGHRAWPYLFAGGWLAMEYGKMFLSRELVWFPWFMLGYTQWAYTKVIQAASLAGVYGVSAAVCFSGALLGAVLAAEVGARRGALRLIPAAALAGAMLAFGAVELYRADRLPRLRSADIALMQPSIDFYAKWDAAEEENVKAAISGLLPGMKGAELAVWPENALPCWIDEPDCEAWMKASVAASGARAGLVGSVSRGGGRHVSAFLTDGAGTIKGSYDKRQLVPFGEYVPFRALVGSFIKPVAALGEFEPGLPEQPLMKAGGLNIGAGICYESIFPYLLASDTRSGADIFVNITNDGWYLDTAAPYQHFIANIFRAVENRRPVVRAANNGISGMIDPWGRVLAKTSLNERTVLRADVPLYPAKAYFPHGGHWFAWGALLAVAAFLLALMLMG